MQTTLPKSSLPFVGSEQASSLVELIVVRVGGQPFGLLLKQVFNIARPEGGTFSEMPGAGSARDYSEIFYRGQILRVVDLAGKLKLNRAKPLAGSEVLISGRLTPDGNIREPFGISVDEISGVSHVALENLRLLDEWVCRKRLGKLIWGAALIERANFDAAARPGEARATSPFKDLMGETSLLASSTGPQGIIRLESGRFAQAGIQSTVEIPLMLLDLEVLRTDLYRY